jgi:hypothetical protein
MLDLRFRWERPLPPCGYERRLLNFLEESRVGPIIESGENENETHMDGWGHEERGESD